MQHLGRAVHIHDGLAPTFGRRSSSPGHPGFAPAYTCREVGESGSVTEGCVQAPFLVIRSRIRPELLTAPTDG